jgi:hypothetical protein
VIEMTEEEKQRSEDEKIDTIGEGREEELDTAKDFGEPIKKD